MAAPPKNPNIVPQDRLLDTKEASAFLAERGIKLAVSTLQKLRWSGEGPVFRKLKARVYYCVDDLIAWVDENTKRLRSTSQRDEDE